MTAILVDDITMVNSGSKGLNDAIQLDNYITKFYKPFHPCNTELLGTIFFSYLMWEKKYKLKMFKMCLSIYKI